MKKQLHYITIILMLAGMVSGYGQELKKGQQEGEYYVVRDTIDGRAYEYKYSSEKTYLNTLKERSKRLKKLKDERRIYESNQRMELAKLFKLYEEAALKNDSITSEMVQKQKEIHAEQYARRISAHNELIDAQLAFEKLIIDSNYYSSDNSGESLKFLGTPGITSVGSDKYRKRVTTTSGLTLGLGYKFIDGNNLGIDDFSYGNNNYFSIGINWKTTLNKSQTLRFKYGIEYQSLGTELNGNRAFTISDPNNTQIERLTFNADKAKFRQDQLVFPLHFEIGGTERREYENGRVRYSETNQLKFGLGGYAGLNMRSQLKFKFDQEGEDIKQTTINSFDNNIFVYGVDAYVGFDSFAVFGRMALNDIFKSGSVDGQYIAFGIRFQ